MAQELEVAGKYPSAEDEAGGSKDLASQYLSFTLAEETFAIDIRYIREIIEYESVTTVPMMPAFLRGVINLRGRVVPVIDLAVRFGRSPTEVRRRTCIVIIEIRGQELSQDLGILVDSVNEVVEIEEANQERPPAFGAGLRNDFIAAIGKVDGRFIVVLDIDQALSIEEMSALAESASVSLGQSPSELSGR